MGRHLKVATLATGSALALLSAVAPCKEYWSTRHDAHRSLGTFGNTAEPEAMTVRGPFPAVEHFGHSSYADGYRDGWMSLRAGDEEVSQHVRFAGRPLRGALGWLPGSVTSSVDVHRLRTAGDHDDVRVVTPRVSYFGADRRFFLDFSYTWSTYESSLSVSQWTPTLGYGFQDGADWLQFRGYFVSPSNSAGTPRERDTRALEAKWTHWFGDGGFWGLDRLQAGALVGRRNYGFDADAVTVYNFEDTQTGTYSLGAVWDLGTDWGAMLLGGLEKYEKRNIADEYDNQFLYLNVSKKW